MLLEHRFTTAKETKNRYNWQVKWIWVVLGQLNFSAMKHQFLTFWMLAWPKSEHWTFLQCLKFHVSDFISAKKNLSLNSIGKIWFRDSNFQQLWDWPATKLYEKLFRCEVMWFVVCKILYSDQQIFRSNLLKNDPNGCHIDTQLFGRQFNIQFSLIRFSWFKAISISG